jgi:hypothetical protein
MFGFIAARRRSTRATKQAGARRSLRAGAVSLLLAVASVGTLAGCGNISVTDRSPVNPPQQRPPVTQETHDVAIAAVDFDPALNSQQFATAGQHFLLVAVENKGNRRETSFTVTAQLLTQDRRQVLMSAQRTVTLLAPGDITVVRFPVDSLPPRQRAYILNTQIQPVPRETSITNNGRTLEIQVN